MKSWAHRHRVLSRWTGLVVQSTWTRNVRNALKFLTQVDFLQDLFGGFKLVGKGSSLDILAIATGRKLGRGNLNAATLVVQVLTGFMLGVLVQRFLIELVPMISCLPRKYTSVCSER